MLKKLAAAGGAVGGAVLWGVLVPLLQQQYPRLFANPWTLRIATVAVVACFFPAVLFGLSAFYRLVDNMAGERRVMSVALVAVVGAALGAGLTLVGYYFHRGSAGQPTVEPQQAVTPTGPIENLAALGWDVKGDSKSGVIFEVTAKPLPDMEESAVYFRALRKPFRLHLQQVSSIAGLRFLSGVDNCVGVEISASDTEDLSELRGLTGLRTLSVSQTPFTTRSGLNIDAVASLVDLEILSLNMSRVSGLEPLRGLTKLTSLNVGGSLVRDLSPVKELKALKSVDVRDSGITGVSVLSGDDALEDLSVDAKQLSSLVSLSQLPRFSKLYIITGAPVDLAAVGTLSRLRSLFIWGPAALDLSPLRKLSELTTLDINGFGSSAGRPQLAGVDAIGSLTRLKSLGLEVLPIDSLGFLAGCNNLVELSLARIPIGSISELANLTSLKQISFVDIPVVDISPLLSLPNLAKLNLLRTPARADVITELERRGVKVTIN